MKDDNRKVSDSEIRKELMKKSNSFLVNFIENQIKIIERQRDLIESRQSDSKEEIKKEPINSKNSKEPTKLFVDEEYCTDKLIIQKEDGSTTIYEKVEGLRQSDWVSVKTKLPEYNLVVLVFIPVGEFGLRTLGYVSDGEIWYNGTTTITKRFEGNVTYWMPLPSPPSPVSQREGEAQ